MNPDLDTLTIMYVVVSSIVILTLKVIDIVVSINMRVAIIIIQ